MSTEYIPALLLIFAATAFGVFTLLIARFLRPIEPGAVKSEPYECGIKPKTDAQARVSIHYYIIAVLFLIFDVEVMFLFPWAIKYNALALFGWIEMALFIVILLLGYIYAWRKGALDWIYGEEHFGKM